MRVAGQDKVNDTDAQRTMSRRILVVEDETDLLEAVSFALKKDGLKPIPAENGEDALRLLRTPRQ